MISYNRFTLSNGLRVIHHKDPDTNIAVLNILYNVGARDESADKTGFAHLFEHLMFGGSVNIAEYDKEVEHAGGSNNAFTNNDYTNYYITLPLENIETGFWLESDRMLQLDFSQKILDVQRGVVLEEFKQRCFNGPFGMLWHDLRELLYKKHPYRWPTIGLELSHIEDARLEDVEAFYYKHYHPANAILCVAGNIDLDETKKLCEKWFGTIHRKDGIINTNTYEQEPLQTERRFASKTDLSPNNAVFLAWRGPGHKVGSPIEPELIADLLGGSETSPLHVELVKKSGAFNAAECFYSRGLDDGIFTVYGILNDGISHTEAEEQLFSVLHNWTHKGNFSTRNLEMVQNKTLTHLLFDKTNLMNKAQKLCYYENLGDIEEVNRENEKIKKPSLHDIVSFASATFRPDNASVLHYSPRK